MEENEMEEKNFFDEACGAIESEYDIRDYKIVAASNFPKKYSIGLLPQIKNQKSTGSCVAHALSSLIEYHHMRQHTAQNTFSTEFIYGMREASDHKGSGLVIRQALKAIQKYGDVYYDDCPGNHEWEEAMENIAEQKDKLVELAYPHRISTYVKLTTEDEIKTALMQNGPVIVSMRWYKGYKLVDDIFTWDPKATGGLHCLLVYGWDERGWLVQNSYGKSWAKDGRFVVPYNFEFREAWGITDTITDLTIIKPKENKVMSIIYKALNVVVNFAKKLWKK